MPHITLILSCWAVCTAAFVVLLIYRGHLTRQEVDVVHLSETDGHSEVDHDIIVDRVNRLNPFVRGFGAAALLCTLLMIGVYVASILPNVHF